MDIELRVPGIAGEHSYIHQEITRFVFEKISDPCNYATATDYVLAIRRHQTHGKPQNKYSVSLCYLLGLES